jgi:Flp pilus assembly pilin Flp
MDMKNLATKAIVKIHDRKLQNDLRRDEEGLTMLAYALGAAIVIVPLAILVVGFGTKAVNDAGVIVDTALPAS